MKLTIFGASRGVGRAALDAAVLRGHSVTGIARAAGDDAQRVHWLAGDVLDAAIVAAGVNGADAVLVALGTSPAEKRGGAQAHVCSQATRAILAAMANAGAPRRIVVVSSYGVGPTRDKRPFPFNLVAATVLRDVMDDKEHQEDAVRSSSFDWTIAQPLGLTDAPRSGEPYVSTDGTHRKTRVARADVAAVCLDAIEQQRFVRETIAISGSA